MVLVLLEWMALGVAKRGSELLETGSFCEAGVMILNGRVAFFYRE